MYNVFFLITLQRNKMTKFFDPTTHTLHVVETYAGAIKIPQPIVNSAIRVKNLILNY